MSPLIGQTIDRYQIIEQLGEGGMAFVYKAIDTRLESTVAVKVIRTERLTIETMEKTLRRFEREAKALAGLTHPNIVKVTDYGEVDGKPYLVMPYFPGGTLKQYLGHPMPYQEAARLLAPIAHALAYAHEHHIIHRDVKPSNILLTEKGQPMLSDFGIAKIISEEATVDLTGTSATVGTPEYMSPEQSLGRTIDYRCDIYSLGVVFYELVTGRKPFLGNTPMEIVFKHISDPLPPPTQFVPDLPYEAEQVLIKALAKQPEQRYQSMTDFDAALDKLSGAPATPVPLPKPVQSPVPKPVPSSVPKPVPSSTPGLDLITQPPPIEPIKPRGKLPTGGKIALAVVGACLAGIVCLGIAYVVMKSLGITLPTSTSPTITRGASYTPPPTALQPAVTDGNLVPPERVQIRWFVGLGTGTDPAQVEVEQAVVDAFNAAHENIELILEVVPYDSARDTLATQIAAGAGPDIVGPVGWAGSNAFYGQWLDLTAYMQAANYDTSVFDPALVAMYQTEEGQVGLPFAVFPAAVFYNPHMFDEAGLNYPPADWGAWYTMPDGSTVAWDYDAMSTIARLLTIDVNGNNATEYDFDRNNIVQYGWSPTWSGHPSYLGTYHGASKIYAGEAGSYTAVIPENWKAAWNWYYDGIWGDEPFIPNGAVAGSAEFGSGNTFNSGKIAMTITNLWYTCCLGDYAKAGFEFQFGALPSFNGTINGRVDADTFRVWKGTAHPAEAFEVLSFLIGPEGVQPLLVGTLEKPGGAYGAFPAFTALQTPAIDAKKAQYPFVTTWDTIIAGNSYPDVPSAEGYMPNWSEAWARIQTFGDLMNNTEGLDIYGEIGKLQDDLGVIFNK